MDNRVDHSENVALRKLGELPEGFAFSGWEIIGPDCVLYRGGVTRKITRGPRKGERTWDKITHKVAVTQSEIIDEKRRYETETGNCAECSGTGEVWAGWHHINGHRYKTCTKCGGSGKAI